MLSTSQSIFNEQSDPVQDSPARYDDRRAASRNYAVYRACRLQAGPRQAIGIIRNTSIGGAEIQTFASLEVGDEITYDDPHLGARSAVVVWARNDRIGVKNMTMAETMSQSPTARNHRAIRFEMAKAARLWMNGQYHAAHLTNISQTGLNLFIDQGIQNAKAGTLASICLDGRSFLPCVLRWYDEAHAGFKFEKALTLGELSDLITRST